MRSKEFLRYYLITASILLAIAAIPLWNFASMVICYMQKKQLSFNNFREVLVFAAVTAAIIIAFLIMPLLKNIKPRLKHLLASSLAVLVFCGVEAVAEKIAVRLYMLEQTFTAQTSFLEVKFLLADPLLHQKIIPVAMRLHYYIFSIVMVLAVVNWLYSLAGYLFEDKKPDKKLVIVNGMAIACYAAAFLLVQSVRYNNYLLREVTWGTVLNIAACFILAALATGLCIRSFVPFAGRKKIIPSLCSALTVLALYGAEFVMLGGRFYSYGGNMAISVLLPVLIVITPAILVQVLLLIADNKKGKLKKEKGKCRGDL
jgi:hypothetical protein